MGNRNWEQLEKCISDLTAQAASAMEPHNLEKSMRELAETVNSGSAAVQQAVRDGIKKAGETMDNQNRNPNWEEIGRSLNDVIDRAVNSQNFEKLDQTIRSTVNTAVDMGGDALRKAMQEASDRRKYTVEPTPQYRTVRYSAPEKKKEKPLLYGNTMGYQAWGIVKIVAGSIFGAGFGLSVLSSFSLGLLGLGPGLFSLAGGILGAGFLGNMVLLGNGITNLTAIQRFHRYTKRLGEDTHCKLETLAAAVGKPAAFVQKDLSRMIQRGWFLEGHLDNEGRTLLTSHETFHAYEHSRALMEARQEQERQKQQRKAEKQTDPKLREVLERGEGFLPEIRACNDRIPGETISRKISAVESTVQSIFDRARKNPEHIPDLRKLMDYYLPMTVKLLNAYADMDAQPVQSAAIRKSKQEIEDSLDTLNEAFQKLLDSLFQKTAMDVSSDISVLKTLLAQEGLTEDDLQKNLK